MCIKKAWSAYLIVLLINPVFAQGTDKIEEALSEVRDVKSVLFSRESSVLGTLPGPGEMAAHQLRCRPVPIPEAGLPREIQFDAAAQKRAAEFDPMKLRKSGGRMGMTILPLGITGAYVSESKGQKELLVVHVLENSPSTGLLQTDDIIFGANGRLFEDLEDPRPEMGNALAESQSPEIEGLLTLQIVRAKKPLNVKIDLGNALPYSDTWPYDCKKSREMREDALAFVMSHYPWHRYNFWTPLFLMASGDDAALEMARRHLCAGLKDEYEEGTGCSAWVGGYRLTSLCEYYLLTGDSSVLPAIKHQAQSVAWAQYRSGSWSHGGGRGPGVTSPGSVGGGYGEVNNAGLGAFIGLCLAKQCGVNPYDHTLPRSIRFFGSFCGSNLPYGLGSPSDRSGRMDNGMNSMGAIAFHLLGEKAMAERWARTVCYMWMGRERGHAEAIFSAAWGPIGAALAPKEEFQAFMKHMQWAYEMGRTRDGGITYMRGSRWTYPNMTAAYGLFLYLPECRLQVLGGDSVFAQRPPAGLEKAAQLYKSKQWAELRAFLAAYLKAEHPPANLTYAKKLLAAHDRMEKQAAATLEIIEKSIADGMRGTAQKQLDLLARMLGEERDEAARLRKLLGDGKLKDRKREKPKPVINEKEIVKQLQLAKGGIRDGFAHSPGYISQTNESGFDGMSPRQIAGYLGHFAGGPADGAAVALAKHGHKTLPLIKRLMTDKHHGIRAGALNALKHMFASDRKEYLTEVTEEQAEIIKLVRPLMSDDSSLVRSASSRLVLSMKVLNEDIYAILQELARQGVTGIGSVVRHGIKDPPVRTKLCMELTDAANRKPSTVPAHYIPLVIATTAHMELCEPYIKTAVDIFKNPEVLNLYGFFSNHPPNGALQIFERYARHPLVQKNLTTMLRFAARKRGGMNSYWYPIVEYPHRIIVKTGPDALPLVNEFCKAEAELYQRIQAGKENSPSWWKEDAVEYFKSWQKEMEVTSELVRCLYGKKPPAVAVPSMCRIYLSNRPWGHWERQKIRDRITILGVAVLPDLRRASATHAPLLLAELDKQIVAKQGQSTAKKDRGKKRKIENEIKALNGKKTELNERVSELEELALLVKILNANEPTAENVRALCRFFVKRPWGNQYPFIQSNLSYMRPLHEKQLTLARNTLQRWGERGLPALRDFIESDKQALANDLAELDKEEKFWKPIWIRKSLMPLARIAQERKD
ncbi:MAG: DUF6288 domain-containing protein, partial [Planctomycetota bacterium]|nr:DUF6288 domain-containing protein [Planctomycetota bacterium]